MSLTDHRERPDSETRPSDQPARRGSPWNVPNLITFSRLALAIVLFWLIDRGNHWLTSCVVFLVAGGD
jgi:phosphatidylglycerophosphate synthase